jgi:hypothetical protein
VRPIDPEALELHDAVLVAIDAEPEHRRLRMRLEVYLEGQATSTRTHCTISFEAVTRHVETIDWSVLAKHAKAGNVVYWNPARGKGTTEFHFVCGFMSVTAGRVDVLVDA